MKTNIITLDKVDSTNDEIKRRIRDGSISLSDLNIMIAAEQTKGKGRHGNSWLSSYGGLYLTFNIRNDFVENPLFLNFYVGNIVFDSINDIYPDYRSKLVLKWPNDIYIEDKKLCGVLLETLDNDLKNFIIGVGINTANKELPDIGVSLESDRNSELLESIIGRIDDPVYKTDIIDRYVKNLKVPQKYEYEYTSGKTKINGRLIKIDRNTGEASIMSGSDVIQLSF